MNNDPPLIDPTLRSAGYEDGDFYPILAYSTRSIAINETSVSGWNPGFETNEFQIVASDHPGDVVLMASYRVNPNGEEIDVRLRNETDGEPIPGTMATESGGASWRDQSVGPIEYSPPTQDSPVSIQPEFRNDVGSAVVKLSIAQVQVGVLL